MTPDAQRLLDSIRSAGSLQITENDPLHPVALELFKLRLVRFVGGVWKEKRHVAPGHLTRAKTTDSATPVIVSSGSRSGLIPPVVTEDGRINRTPRTDPRK
jgi:hypothetical protein